MNKSINLYYKKNTQYKKNSKLKYYSTSVIRSLYLIKLNPIHFSSEKKVYSRSSNIPNLYKNIEVNIHYGKSFKIKIFNKWNIGFKFGEFTWNRKLALYKAKQLKKKK